MILVSRETNILLNSTYFKKSSLLLTWLDFGQYKTFAVDIRHYFCLLLNHSDFLCSFRYRRIRTPFLIVGFQLSNQTFSWNSFTSIFARWIFDIIYYYFFVLTLGAIFKILITSIITQPRRPSYIEDGKVAWQTFWKFRL